MGGALFKPCPNRAMAERGPVGQSAMKLKNQELLVIYLFFLIFSQRAAQKEAEGVVTLFRCVRMSSRFKSFRSVKKRLKWFVVSCQTCL